MSSDARVKPLLITREDELARVAERLSRSPRVAFDLESNGMHAYRATACIIQLACDGEVIIIDAHATSLLPIGDLLASSTTEKIVHDVAFDARILAEAGVFLSELADRLFAEVNDRGIAEEVEEETRYRLASAIAGAGVADPRPPYVRLKGIDRVPEVERPILRHLANIREDLARELDVPPYKVLGPDVLFEIAKRKPETLDDLAKIRGAMGGRRARSIANELLDAVTAGLEDGAIPPEDRVWFEKPKIPGATLRARRAREQRLTRWRKEEAKKRGIDEQVILPGHVLQGIADLDVPSLEALADVPGIGAFRVARHGEALLAALTSPVPVSEPAEPAS